MNFTLTRNLTFAQAGEILLKHYQRTQTRLYRRLMKRLKAQMKKPVMKLLIKLNNGVEKSLKVSMRFAHRFERTWAFCFLGWFAKGLVGTVRRDGLKFTILLTSLGYAAWCYFI